MKKTAILLLIILTGLKLNSQVFQVDTLQYKGDSNKYINIVVLGDGYMASQQTNFIADANTLTSYVMSQSPWNHYAGYFNIFAIRVISAQAGAKHPNTASDCNTAVPLVPVSSPGTYLGCGFDYMGIHRLIVPQNNANIANVLSANFPNYDQVLIISNTPYYGGSGGTYATASLDPASNEIIAHELGHSFAALADEYYVGDSYAVEKANMTQQTNPALIKWKNWLGDSSIGIYQHCCGGNSALWYRPHNNCKMRYLNSPYCSVCSQAIIESVHSLVNPIVNYLPNTSTVTSANQFIDFKLAELMKPLPNTLKIKWTLNTNPVASNIDSLHFDQSTLSNGTYTLAVSVTDTSSLLRVDNHASIHINFVTWVINKTNTGIRLSSGENKLSYALYPNPANNILNISLDLDKRSDVTIDLFSQDGKLIKQIANKAFDAGQSISTINIENFANGNYFIVFKIDGVVQSQSFIKQN